MERRDREHTQQRRESDAWDNLCFEGDIESPPLMATHQEQNDDELDAEIRREARQARDWESRSRTAMRGRYYNG